MQFSASGLTKLEIACTSLDLAQVCRHQEEFNNKHQEGNYIAAKETRSMEMSNAMLACWTSAAHTHTHTQSRSLQTLVI